MPWTMGAFAVGGLSLIGVPLTAGFVGKWYLVSSALETGAWPVAGLILATSLIALLYIGRIVESAFLNPLQDEHKSIKEAPLSLLVPTWGIALANIYFGLDSSGITHLAKTAASGLLGNAL